MKSSGLSPEPEPTPPKPYWLGRILAAVAIAFTAVIVVLELTGVLHEAGEVLTVIGTGMGVYALLTTATKEQMEKLDYRVAVEGVRTRNNLAVGQGSLQSNLQAILGKLGEILEELRKK